MIFGDYFYAHVFKFTGGVPTTCYIDLSHAGEVVLQKTLVFSVPNDGWILELTEAETLAHKGTKLTGHLVTVVGGVAAPVALVQIDVGASLTQRRP